MSSVLSIDVGLKNLAMCIMSLSQDKERSIKLWDVFNVLDDNDIKCCKTLKNGKECSKKSKFKYFCTTSKETFLTCKIHFPKNIPIKKQNKVKTKNVNSYLLQDISLRVLNKLNDILKDNKVFKDVDKVLIELQPKVNQRMKFISHIIYGKLVEFYKETRTKIRFVTAKTKLRVYDGPKIECNLKTPYSKRKWLSIQYTGGY